MPLITISGTQINFPNSSSSPNWAEALVQFAEAVQDALNGVAGEYDVVPQVYDMVADVNSNVELPNLAFPVSEVSAVIMTYDVERDPDTATSNNIVRQTGSIIMSYNEDNATNEKWTMAHVFNNSADITFDISDDGTVTFSTSSIATGIHSGKIRYSAKAIKKA